MEPAHPIHVIAKSVEITHVGIDLPAKCNSFFGKLVTRKATINTPKIFGINTTPHGGKILRLAEKCG
jgi:hypothetical protein